MSSIDFSSMSSSTRDYLNYCAPTVQQDLAEQNSTFSQVGNPDYDPNAIPDNSSSS